MTICIALADKDGVTVGADRLASSGGEVTSTSQIKWHIDGPGVAVAFSGPAAIQCCIRGIADGNKEPGEFCAELRKEFRLLDRWNPTEDKTGELPWWDLNLIFTDGSKIWECGTYLYPDEIPLGEPSAIGSGHKYALGAMRSAENFVSYLRVVEAGLESAIHYDVNCGGEPWTARIDKKETTK